MERIPDNNFFKALQGLEDLYFLSEKKDLPLIENVFFNISEYGRKLKDSSIHSPNSLKELSEIGNFLNFSIEKIVEDFYLNFDSVENFVFQLNDKQLDLGIWDKILFLIPKALNITRELPFFREIQIQVSKENLTLIGELSLEKHFESKRKEIYSITKTLGLNEVLLTFSIEDKKSESPVIKLVFDISFNPQLVYEVPLSKENNSTIHFPNIFKNYISSPGFIDQIGPHQCIEIKDDYSINHFNSLPKEYVLDQSKKEFLHFPFLFRPLSIIIPCKGKIIPTLSKENLKIESDSDNNSEPIKTKFIDFFSLLFK